MSKYSVGEIVTVQATFPRGASLHCRVEKVMPCAGGETDYILKPLFADGFEVRESGITGILSEFVPVGPNRESFWKVKVSNLENKLWSVQQKDVEDIQFWKDRYKASQEKRLDDGVAIYNLKEKIRKLEDSDYEPRYTSGYFDETAEKGYK